MLIAPAMIMINAIADAKTGRSMKKFMTQFDSGVGAPTPESN